MSFHNDKEKGLEIWMAERDRLEIGKRKALFCSISGADRGKALSDAAIRIKFKRLQSKAGIQKRFHPHALRHSYAVECTRRGIPTATIQRLLGHSDLATTAIYLSSLSAADISEAILKAGAW
jgi:site-specific recombinase XerD